LPTRFEARTAECSPATAAMTGLSLGDVAPDHRQVGARPSSARRGTPTLPRKRRNRPSGKISSTSLCPAPLTRLPAPRNPTPRNRVRAKSKFVKPFKLIRVVSPPAKNISLPFFEKKMVALSPPASAAQGAYRDRHERWWWDAGGRDGVVRVKCNRRAKQFVSRLRRARRATLLRTEKSCGLTPRRWCQVSLGVARSSTGQRCAAFHGMTRGKKARSPHRARNAG
jgi:hypothetical protein